jgi:hypothetical protein
VTDLDWQERGEIMIDEDLKQHVKNALDWETT